MKLVTSVLILAITVVKGQDETKPSTAPDLDSGPVQALAHSFQGPLPASMLVGRECSYSSECESSSSSATLACVGGVCGCSNSDYEFYDHVRDTCVIKVGKRCSPPKFHFGENNPCGSNAFCGEKTRLCECSGLSFPSPNGDGRCLRKKDYNESCSSSAECDNMKYLSCLSGVCACKLSTYDDYHQLCRRKVGDFCMRTRDCVSNSYCSESESRCVCDHGYGETSAKTCGLSYNQRCGSASTSDPDPVSCSDIYFACVNGVCRCKNPSYEVYDNRTGTCLSLVGGLCHLYLPNGPQPLKLKNCVRHAECLRRDSSPLSQCECVKGFVETLSGHCKLPQGSTCAVPGESLVVECVEPLVCRNMKCECQNENDIYDPELKLCRRITGSLCSKDNECIRNSGCFKSRCKCLPGFLPTFRGDCLPELQPLPQQYTTTTTTHNPIPYPHHPQPLGLISPAPNIVSNSINNNGFSQTYFSDPPQTQIWNPHNFIYQI